MSMSHTCNPTGKNQHGATHMCLIHGCPYAQYNCLTLTAKADDEVLTDALHQYHKELLTNNKKISARLFSDQDIKMR
jgi:hypothetical protein